VKVRLTVDGVAREADARTDETLLSVLRERLGVAAAKNACEHGRCGSCTVEVDGELACACLVLAGQADGSHVVTAAGVAAPGGELTVLQEAFLEAGAVQCGFCTPGMLLVARDLLAREPEPTAGRVREALAGNLCRCTGYQKIVDAVLLAAERMAEDPGQR